MYKISFIYLSIIVFLTNNLFAFAAFSVPPEKFVVVLDAGHGGHDSGNRGNGYFEKNIALEIILKTGKQLEKDPNIKVIYTRKTDVFIELNKRADIANKAKADLFVSVHCNAHSSSAYGTETFVLGLHANERNFNIAKKENSVILLEDDYKTNYDGFDPNSPESVIGLTLMQEEYLDQSLDLASHIQGSFTKQLKRFDRGVKQAGFLVLHRTFMPSVLIETGFLTNKNEGKYLNSDKGKQDMAASISKAILKYKQDVAYMYESINNDVAVETTKVEKETIKNDSVNTGSAPQEKIVVKPTTEMVVSKKNDTTVATTKIEKETTKKDSVDTGSASQEKTMVKPTAEKVVPETNEIIFKIQLLAGSSKIPVTPDNFKGLSNVSVAEEKGVFHYFYENKNSYEAIKKEKQTAIDKGYKSCFVVAFKNGLRIPLSEAVK